MSETVETSQEMPQLAQIEVLASGLDSPRKLSFGADGALYVAEAGRGGTGASIPSPSVPGEFVFYGATGAITRIQNGVAERVVTGLPSLALPNGSDAAGVSDIEFDADGNAYAIVGLASSPANRDEVLKVPDFSQLIAIDSFENGGSWTRLQDFGAYEQANNPDGQNVDTNLYDLLIDDNTAYVVDAGANDLLSQQAFSSEVKLEAVFPARPATNPLTSEEIVQQSVPTSVAVGPDGALYVSELAGFPFTEGSARVYRINEAGQPEVYAEGGVAEWRDESLRCHLSDRPLNPPILGDFEGSEASQYWGVGGRIHTVIQQRHAEGFMNITDLAFDQSGGLYVLEYDANGFLNEGDAGALIYVSPDGKTRTTIAGDELTNPTGLEIGANSDIYISNKGFVAGEGEVLRLSLKPEFDCILNPPKASITGEGANHYSITNEDNLEQKPDKLTLDQANVNGATQRRSELFSRSHLLGDQGAFDYIHSTGGDLNPNVGVMSRTPLS